MCTTIIWYGMSHTIFFLNISNTLYIKIFLDVAPKIENFNEYTELVEGQTAILSCNVTGNPMPSVIWYKNHHEIQFSETNKRVIKADNNSLIIYNLTDKDEAIYACKAFSNSTKYDIKEGKLIVNGMTVI